MRKSFINLSCPVLMALLAFSCARNTNDYPACTDEKDQTLLVVEFFDEKGILPRNTFPMTLDVFVEAAWSGVQRLDPAYELECQDPYIQVARLMCTAGNVFSLTLENGDVMQVLSGLPADDLERIPEGTTVRYKVDSSDTWLWKYGPGLNMVIEESSSGKLLLAAMSWERFETFPDHDFGPMIVRPDLEYVCTYKTYMDCKHYGVTALAIEASGETFRLEPGNTIVVPTPEGHYRVGHIRGKDRTCFQEACCADPEWDHFSYWIVAAE